MSKREEIEKYVKDTINKQVGEGSRFITLCDFWSVQPDYDNILYFKKVIV